MISAAGLVLRKSLCFMDLLGLLFLLKAIWRGFSSMPIVALLVLLWHTFILIGFRRGSHCCPSILSMFIGCSSPVSWFLLNSWMICEFSLPPCFFLFFDFFYTELNFFRIRHKNICGMIVANS